MAFNSVTMTYCINNHNQLPFCRSHIPEGILRSKVNGQLASVGPATTYRDK